MNIACLAILDNGNLMRHLARGLRDYCHVKATAYVQQPDSYVHIPDTTVERWTGDVDTDDYDFIITNDHTYRQYHAHLRDKPRLVKCNGTYAKNNHTWFHWDHLKYDTLYVSSPTDYSLASKLPFSIQTLPPIIDTRLLPEPDFSEEQIRVGHAPSTHYKGTKDILKLLHPYRKQGTIDIDIITNTPWTECIQRKAQCHIFIDQLTHKGAFGVNAIESLALGSIVLANPLHPYILQHMNPPIHKFPDDLPIYLSEKGIEAYWNSGFLTQNTITYRHEWAISHFDLSTQAPKWMQWITWITEH